MTDSVAWRARTETPGEEGGLQLLAYHLYAGVVVIARAEHLKNRFYTHWAEIPQDGWVRTANRPPRQGDADIYGCVLAQTDKGLYCVRHISRAQDAAKVPMWRPMPEKPKEE